jgi:hypothetical protein
LFQVISPFDVESADAHRHGNRRLPVLNWSSDEEDGDVIDVQDPRQDLFSTGPARNAIAVEDSDEDLPTVPFPVRLVYYDLTS